jgi:hypothetical protein
VLAGCGGQAALLSPQSEPVAGKSALFARLGKDGLLNFELLIENVGRTRQYVMRFSPAYDISVIEVEPDRYEITELLATNVLHQVLGRKPLEGWPYRLAFEARPGRIHYLGDFAGSYTSGPLRLPFNTRPNAVYRFADLEANGSSPALAKGSYSAWMLAPAVDRFDATAAGLQEQYPNLRHLQRERAFVAAK